MKVGIVVVTNRYDVSQLYRSVASNRHAVRWYLHHHGRHNEAARFIALVQANPGVAVTWHGYNRGLSASWNDGLKASLDAGDDISLLVNDDITFDPGAFDRFIDFVAANPRGICCVFGREQGGVQQNQGLACCAIGHDVLGRVGFFDQNFFPAYYEDFDYLHRVALAGLAVHIDERVLVSHHRGGTTKGRRLFRLMMKWHLRRSGRYYQAKWGIVGGQRTFAMPFGSPETPLKIAWACRGNPYPELTPRLKWSLAWARLIGRCLRVFGLRMGRKRGSEACPERGFAPMAAKPPDGRPGVKVAGGDPEGLP